MERLDNIIAKINHLRSLSSGNMNENEAAAAAAAADRLIAQYQLSEADLIIKGVVASEPAQITNEYLYRSDRVMLWRHELARVLCNAYGCTFFTTDVQRLEVKGICRRTTEKAFQMVGRPSDIKITQYMFAWLGDEIERLTKENAYGGGYNQSQGYARGVVKGIKMQLEQEHLRAQREAARAGQSSAMVLLDNRFAAADLAMRSAKDEKGKPLIHTVKLKTQVSHDRSAHGMGVERGLNIPLKKGLEGGSDPKKLK